MRRTSRGALLAAAGAVLALLPLSPALRAADLGDEASCSRADAHASQSHEGATTPDDTAEAALAVEATRPLPPMPWMEAASATAAHEAGEAPVDTDLQREPGTGGTLAAGAIRAGWVAPVATPGVESPDAIGTGDSLDDDASAPLAFRDSAAPRERVRDLRRLRELKLLRLFDTSELMVWLGLDRKGRPGLHFRQRNPGEAMPPPAQAAFLAEPPPLRSVPLTSP